jgi:hypothetical protein
MSSTLTSLARAIAVERETAQPISTVRHVHIGDRPLVFVPLALAGEVGAPLAAMAGTDPKEPNLLVVAEPRDRDQRFAFAAELAGLILPYVQSYVAAGEPTAGREPGTRYADAPQLLVPNRPRSPSPACSAVPPGSAGRRASTRWRRTSPSPAGG